MIKLLILMAPLLLGWPLDQSYGAIYANPGAISTPTRPAWLGPRPSKWCGWWLRGRLGVRPSKYNLARSWYGFGSPAQPQVGAVVVWPHHVGLIVGRNQRGQWLIQSGNDGGRVKVRPWANIHKAKFRIV